MAVSSEVQVKEIVSFRAKRFKERAPFVGLVLSAEARINGFVSVSHVACYGTSRSNFSQIPHFLELCYLSPKADRMTESK